MTNRIVLELPLPPKALSPNARHGHWGARKRAAAAYRRACAGVFARVGALPPPVTVHLEFYLARPTTDREAYERAGLYYPKDEANATAAFKAGQDALQDAGVVPGDSAKYVRQGGTTLRTTKAQHGGRACVMVTLETARESEERT